MLKQKHFRTDIDLLRHIAEGILQALHILHQSDLVHRNLRHSCVYIDNTGQIRLAEYCLESKINEVLSIPGI